MSGPPPPGQSTQSTATSVLDTSPAVVKESGMDFQKRLSSCRVVRSTSTRRSSTVPSVTTSASGSSRRNNENATDPTTSFTAAHSSMFCFDFPSTKEIKLKLFSLFCVNYKSRTNLDKIRITSQFDPPT